MEINPVLSAYKDEQCKLDNYLAEEIIVWREIKKILDVFEMDIELGLSNGLPDMHLVRK
jgi:hypothetical protein